MRHSRVAAAIIVAGLIVAGAVYVSMGGTFNWSTAVTSGNPSLVRPIGTSDHILGNPAAPIVIVEYCDFTSDFCKGFSHALHQIVATEGARGEVAWAYRAFPLAETEGDALAHARAAECVAKVAGNDAFWSFADLLYAEQPVKPAQYGELAQKAGITGTSFATCYADAANQVDARIEADRKNALDIGASGAPYSILLINGRAPAVLDGAYTYDALRQVLDEALGQ